MHAKGQQYNSLLAAGIFLLQNAAPGFCKEVDLSSLQRDFAQHESSVQMVNNFTVRDVSKRRDKVLTFEEAGLIVELLTPLNSSFNKEGDEVQAKVMSSKLTSGAAWLPQETVLTGTIERAQPAAYGKTNGAISLRFYGGRVGDQIFEMNSAPNTADTSVPIPHKKATKKSVVRNALMSAAFIAIPLAIGTGGTSIALTTGAGALIGGVLADDGKHVKGAVAGAWDGSGLGILNPIVRKGNSVVLPVGTKLELRLTEPIHIPADIVKLARENDQERLGQKPVALATSAKLVSPSNIDVSSTIAECQRLIDQKNLAAALNLADSVLKSSPDSVPLQELRNCLIEQATGSTVHMVDHDQRSSM